MLPLPNRVEVARGYRQLGEAQGILRVGSLGNLGGAEQTFRRLIALESRIVAEGGGDSALMAFGNAHTSLGEVMVSMGRPAAAESLLLRNVAIQEEIAARQPLLSTRCAASEGLGVGDIAAGACDEEEQKEEGEGRPACFSFSGGRPPPMPACG